MPTVASDVTMVTMASATEAADEVAASGDHRRRAHEITKSSPWADAPLKGPWNPASATSAYESGENAAPQASGPSASCAAHAVRAERREGVLAQVGDADHLVVPGRDEKVIAADQRAAGGLRAIAQETVVDAKVGDGDGRGVQEEVEGSAAQQRTK